VNVRIIAIGKIKERFLQDGIAEYSKRLGAYCRLEIVELKEESFKEPLSDKERLQIVTKEGERILGQLGSRSFVFVLDVQGKALSSEAFAEQISGLAVQGVSQVDFVIGGALGLSPAVISRADFILSFSNFTFPHQLMRLILAEQLYRAMTIIRGEQYHK
jgi:23S rRNA (pseudouridine1915-N3)-methyltransferase